MLVFEAEPFDGVRASGCGCASCGSGHTHDEIETDCPTYGYGVDERELADGSELVDYVMNRASGTRSYGEPSKGNYYGKQTSNRCGDRTHACPTIKGLEAVTQIDGVPFEYIGGYGDKEGLLWGKTSKRWLVWEAHRKKNRTSWFVPRVGDGLSAFLSNMKAAGMPVEAILSMGSLVCRCVSSSGKLSNHSYGDAIDIGGVRLVGGREVLVANSECDADDRKLLHRINACLRLSFATVFDYHDRLPKPTHWNHFHCDTNMGKERRWGAAHTWGFVRESLGLPWAGGFDKPCAAALKAFAGADAVKDAPALRVTLGKLFLREAVATQPDRAPRYSCHFPLNKKAKPG